MEVCVVKIGVFLAKMGLLSVKMEAFEFDCIMGIYISIMRVFFD